MVDVEGRLPAAAGARELLDPLRCGSLGGDSPPSRLGRGGQEPGGEGGARGGAPDGSGGAASPTRGRRPGGRPNGGSLSTYLKTIDTGDSCSLSGTSCRSKHSQESPLVPFGRTMAVDQHSEARQKLEAAKAYGKRVNNGNKRANMGQAAKQKSKASADGPARPLKGETWRRGEKEKKAGTSYEGDTPSEAHSCLDPICVRDERLREWVSTSSFGQSGSPTVASQQGSHIGDTDGSPTLKAGHARLEVGRLDYQAKLNMRWKTMERAVQATQDGPGVSTPREDKASNGHQDHTLRDRKDVEDCVATLNDPPASSGSGSFKHRSSTLLAARTDSQLVDDCSNPCAHQEPIDTDYLQHDHARIVRTRPKVVYVIRRRCCHCIKHRKNRGAGQGRAISNNKDNKLGRGPAESTDPEGPQDADGDLAARVDGLKALVAARRHQARVLELRLEEKLLLQEADILGEHIARSSKMLENFAMLGSAMGRSLPQRLTDVSGNGDSLAITSGGAADERTATTGTPGVATPPLGAKPPAPEIIIPEVVAPLTCESSPEKLEPEQLMAFREHRPTQLESPNKGHMCVPRAVADEGSSTWALGSIPTPSLCEVTLSKALPAAEGSHADAAALPPSKDGRESWMGASAPGAFPLDPELLDLMDQDFPITSEDLVEDRGLTEASTTDDDDLLYKELRHGAVARLGMASGEGSDEMGEEASGMVARFGKWGAELDELEECGEDVEEVLPAAAKTADGKLPLEYVANPDDDGTAQNRFSQITVTEEPKTAAEAPAADGDESSVDASVVMSQNSIGVGQATDGEVDGLLADGTFATREGAAGSVIVQVVVEAGGDHVVVTIVGGAKPSQAPTKVLDAIVEANKGAVVTQDAGTGVEGFRAVDEEILKGSGAQSSGAVDGAAAAGTVVGVEGAVRMDGAADVAQVIPGGGMSVNEKEEGAEFTDVAAVVARDEERTSRVFEDKGKEVVSKTLRGETDNRRTEKNSNNSVTEVAQREWVAGGKCQKTWSRDDGVCGQKAKSQEGQGLRALDLATSMPQRPSDGAQDSSQLSIGQIIKSSPWGEVEGASGDVPQEPLADAETQQADNATTVATASDVNEETAEEEQAAVGDGPRGRILESPGRDDGGVAQALKTPSPAATPEAIGGVHESGPQEGQEAVAPDAHAACPVAVTPEAVEETGGRDSEHGAEEARPACQDGSVFEHAADIEFGSLEERMMQQVILMHEPVPRLMEPGDAVRDGSTPQIAQLWEPTESHVGAGMWDGPCEHPFMLSDEEGCPPGDCQAEMLDGQSDLWVGFVSSDLSYIGKVVEDVMGYFLADLPDSVQPFGPVVPESCFMELQSSKPDCIREQSVFDRCIFEAVVDAVGAVYRRCNRVEGVNYAPFDRLPLPDERQWIDNVKRQVLRAAEQPAGVDVVDLLLTHDAWVLQQSLLTLEEELM